MNVHPIAKVVVRKTKTLFMSAIRHALLASASAKEPRHQTKNVGCTGAIPIAFCTPWP